MRGEMLLQFQSVEALQAQRAIIKGALIRSDEMTDGAYNILSKWYGTVCYHVNIAEMDRDDRLPFDPDITSICPFEHSCNGGDCELHEECTAPDRVPF